MADLRLTDFRLHQVAAEIRFHHAYELWDKAGMLWARVEELPGTLRNQKAEPGQTTFTLDRSTTLEVRIDRANVTTAFPSPGLEDYIATSRRFFEIVTNTLGVNVYSRVGLRTWWHRRFDGASDAASALLRMLPTVKPPEKHHGIDGHPVGAEFVLAHEGNVLGVRNRLAVVKRGIETQFPATAKDLLPDDIDVEVHELVYDTDFYTVSEVPANKLKLGEWFKDAFHVTKRDAGAFLGE